MVQYIIQLQSTIRGVQSYLASYMTKYRTIELRVTSIRVFQMRGCSRKYMLIWKEVTNQTAFEMAPEILHNVYFSL